MLFRKPHVPVWKKCRKARHAAPVEERELVNTRGRRLRRRVMHNEGGKQHYEKQSHQRRNKTMPHDEWAHTGIYMNIYTWWRPDIGPYAVYTHIYIYIYILYISSPTHTHTSFGRSRFTHQKDDGNSCHTEMI